MGTLLTFFLQIQSLLPFSPSATSLEISGRITDSKTGIPIEKVYIHTTVPEEETLSDAKGNFRLLSLNEKPVKLFIEKKGYKKEVLLYNSSSTLQVKLSPE